MMIERLKQLFEAADAGATDSPTPKRRQRSGIRTADPRPDGAEEADGQDTGGQDICGQDTGAQDTGGRGTGAEADEHPPVGGAE